MYAKVKLLTPFFLNNGTRIHRPVLSNRKNDLSTLHPPSENLLRYPTTKTVISTEVAVLSRDEAERSPYFALACSPSHPLSITPAGNLPLPSSTPTANPLSLAPRRFRLPPVPRDPHKVSALYDDDRHIAEQQVAMRHRTQVEKRLPRHCGISREASIATRAASCSASWRRRSRAKRNTRTQTPHSAQPAMFQ